MNNLRHITCILFAVFFLVSCRNNEQKRMREMNDYLQLIDNKINSLRESHLNLVLDNQTVHLGIDSLNQMELKQIAADHLFFFYFSNQTCSPCIEQTVNYIKEVFPDYEKEDRIYFIAPDYPAQFRRNCYGKQLLTLSTGALGIPLEAENVPFLFTLSDELAIEKMHVVNKNDFIKTLEFLKTIR